MTDRKTAKELDVTDADYAALLATRELLAAPALPKGFVFNMNAFVAPAFEKESICGTACCIGGTMMMVHAGIDPSVEDMAGSDVRLRISSIDVDDEHAFAGLFYPSCERMNWSSFTRADGVRAIDAFLSGNTRSPWSFMDEEAPEE